jgi:hypothetical protein
VIVITKVVEEWELAWHDVKQGLDVALSLDNAGTGRTRATISVSGSDLRLVLEGARGFGPSLPERALVRLRNLCQTAAGL